MFNPNVKRLIDNIESIIHQVTEIVLIDNASTNISQIEDRINLEFPEIRIIKQNENKGIAAALNIIMEYAEEQRYEWVLTLDQDSVVCDSKLIKAYCERTSIPNVGIISSKINDRNLGEKINKNSEILFDQDYLEVDSVITSGSFTNVEIWKSIGGFDDQMFIDRVDTEYCMNLKKNNKKILLLNKIGILHEIGMKPKEKKIFWKKITIFNHPPFRVYFMVRNGIYLSRKYPDSKESKRIRRSSYNRLLLILLFETKKIAKLKKGLIGIMDGYRM